MSPEQVAAVTISLVLLFVFLFFSVPVGAAMGVAGVVGVMYLQGMRVGLGLVPIVAWDSLDKYTFTVVPMFVFMGILAVEAGFSKDLFDAARNWVGGIRGSLAMATTLASAGFGTICGSGVATTATFSKIAVPEMEKAGYDERLAIGCVAASGPLAAIIPPSIIMVYYGLITESSIGKLLMAGFLPGFMLAVIYIIMVSFRTWRDPKLAPPSPSVPWRVKLASLSKVWPVLVIAGMMLGGIYRGVFTPTEGGAFGAASVLLLGLTTRRLGFRSILRALAGTVNIMGMLILIVVGAFLFNHLIAVSGLTKAMVATVEELNLQPMMLMVSFMVIFLISGTFMDTVAMMFLLLPLMFPLAMKAGFDPTWFGILVVVNCEIGMETPPFGLSLFAAKGAMPEKSMRAIISGITPFIICDVIGLILLILFPQIVLLLPNMMD
ncbi:MAG: TRAP transporter large permease [Chloroflexi bacterium]|nr:TRAP transporter large permease [Chloroflexota bacterium]